MQKQLYDVIYLDTRNTDVINYELEIREIYQSLWFYFSCLLLCHEKYLLPSGSSRHPLARLQIVML